MSREKPDEWILVVDDERMVTRALTDLLELESPWRAAEFNRPSDALDSLSARDYQVILSDFLMPEMDGIEFLKRVRQKQPFATRILLTGYADKENAIRSINEVGLYQYLEKPWDNDALLLTLRNAVERSALLRRLDETMRRLDQRDRSMEEFRSRLLKAIL